MEKFLAKVYPKISQILERNANIHIFDSYDVIWEDDVAEETELIHKLISNYDFCEANNATSKSLQKLKDSEKNGKLNSQSTNHDDDDFDEFNDYN